MKGKSHAYWLFFLFANIMHSITLAQDNSSNQLWNEALINYSFANVYNLENNVSYRTNFTSPKYRCLVYRPTLTRSFTQSIDGQVALRFSYVHENDTSKSLEIRPTIGGRIHLTPNRRVLIRALIRFEQRNFKDLETKEWTQSARFRVRPELIIPLNKKSYFENNQWYALFDVEWFFVTDNDVDERFANRFRVRVGPGYRLNANWRFELLFMKQESKSKIGDDFYTSDSVLRARVKYYITKGRSADKHPSDGD